MALQQGSRQGAFKSGVNWVSIVFTTLLMLFSQKNVLLFSKCAHSGIGTCALANSVQIECHWLERINATAFFIVPFKLGTDLDQGHQVCAINYQVEQKTSKLRN